ncbi:MAG: ATPase, partial [Bacteroidaceae bacterium]|nr:ATPase [Bacteroidaceae bacterium]
LCHENCAPAPPLPQPEDLEVTIRTIGERISRAEQDWEDALGAELAILDSHLFLHDKEKRTLKRIFEAQKSNINRYKNELNELSDAHRREKQEYPAGGPETDLFA